MKYDNLSEIRELADYTYSELGHDDLIGTIKVEFNNRFTSRLGDAHYGKGRIRFSTPLWPRTTLEDREQVIIHEACHIVQRKVWPYSNHHGREWKSLMRRMGRRPDRCHSVSTAGLKRKRRKVSGEVIECGCKKGCEIGPIQFKRLIRGAKYRCRKCGHTIKLKDLELEND